MCIRDRESASSTAVVRLGEFDSQVLLSDSGSRVYSVADSQLLALNLFPFDADQIDLDEVDPEDVVPRVVANFTWTQLPTSTTGLDADEILFADDEVLFIRSGDDVVRVLAPER